MKRAVIFDYNSKFAGDIEKTINRYNLANSDKAFSVDVYNSEECPSESMAGPADIIIHSGGDGKVVKEDVEGVPRFYICYSHEMKAEREGGEVVRLKDFVKGVQFIDILEDNEILGKKGKIPIMKYHMLGVVKAPRFARVLATSKVQDASGEGLEIIEALKYPDGSISVQGHPEEGTAAHIFHNFLENIRKLNKD